MLNKLILTFLVWFVEYLILKVFYNYFYKYCSLVSFLCFNLVITLDESQTKAFKVLLIALYNVMKSPFKALFKAILKFLTTKQLLKNIGIYFWRKKVF